MDLTDSDWEWADLSDKVPLSFRRWPFGITNRSGWGDWAGTRLLWGFELGPGEDEFWKREVWETLSEPVRDLLGGATEELVVVLGRRGLLEESEAALEGRRAVFLNENEAVLRAKPGSEEDPVALCRGVDGALTLPPPPTPWVSALRVLRHIFSSGLATGLVEGFGTADGFRESGLCDWTLNTFGSFVSFASGTLLKLERRDEGAVAGLSPRRCKALLLLVVVVLVAPEEPRWSPRGFSRCFTCGLAPLLDLEIGTTRRMPWFSELVRVRTALGLFPTEAEFAAFGPVCCVLEVGDSFIVLAEANDLVPRCEEEAFWPGITDCTVAKFASFVLLVETFVRPLWSPLFGAGTLSGSVEGATASSKWLALGTGWLLMGAGTGFPWAGVSGEEPRQWLRGCWFVVCESMFSGCVRSAAISHTPVTHHTMTLSLCSSSSSVLSCVKLWTGHSSVLLFCSFWICSIGSSRSVTTKSSWSCPWRLPKGLSPMMSNIFRWGTSEHFSKTTDMLPVVVPAGFSSLFSSTPFSTNPSVRLDSAGWTSE